jgi:hypothetical protein
MKKKTLVFLIFLNTLLSRAALGSDETNGGLLIHDLQKKEATTNENDDYCVLIRLWQKKQYSKACEYHEDCPKKFKCNCSDKVKRSEQICISGFKLRTCIPIPEELRFDATKNTPCELKENKR